MISSSSAAGAGGTTPAAAQISTTRTERATIEFMAPPIASGLRVRPGVDGHSKGRPLAPAASETYRNRRVQSRLRGNHATAAGERRSEERRVGKECRSGWSWDH